MVPIAYPYVITLVKLKSSLSVNNSELFHIYGGCMNEKKQKIKQLMQKPLPSLTEQRKLIYRPDLSDASYAYNLLNNVIFDGKLVKPKIEIKRLRSCWGQCVGELTEEDSPYCSKIQLSNRFYNVQWFITILAHEMVHQWQWDIDGVKRFNEGLEPLMSHGPSFYAHKEKMAQLGISLKRWHRTKRWFIYQDFNKC